MVDKSPISILQEYYIKEGLLPQYTLIEENTGGPFTFKVQVAGLSAIGSGISKKQAKHNAANTLLKQLKNTSKNQDAALHQSEPEEPTLKRPHDESSSTPQKVSKLDRPVRPNFVGKLLEYMTKTKSPVPKYEAVGEEGLPHMKQFTMKCTVNEMEVVGTARSKQEAKNVAAEKMWEALQCEKDAADVMKPKRRKLVDDNEFNDALKQFRSKMDELGGSFHFEEETAKEYAIDLAGNTDDLSKFDECDRKMFSFLGTRSLTRLLPEKASIILNIDSGVESRTIGARAWTRQDAVYKTLKDAIEHLSKCSDKIVEENGVAVPEDFET